MDIVVVESPTKAKTIEKYLDGAYQVVASYGHVRDLEDKDGSVLPEEDFRMLYDILPDKKKRVNELADAVKQADQVFLATDPDREGEAISWHLLEALSKKGVLRDKPVKRVVFHEITKQAVLQSMAQPRELDEHLIDAYQARRALDYLVGFKLSPILWRKLQGSRSAGRVQSVALRLICEREDEIERFVPQEYWSIEADFLTPRKELLTARLTHLDGKKLDKMAIGEQGAADAAVQKILAGAYAVSEIERKQVKRNPAPPFTTSTLQQEAARKLGMSAKQTMQVAQRLFEGISLGGETTGLITYMRTDSVQLSKDALGACRGLIGERYGDSYLPETPRQYKTKTKNAQEAHEAIRPTDLFRTPEQLARYLEREQLRLYELIWKRTVASQMAAAVLNRVTIDVAETAGEILFRATGTTVAFDGFFKVYQEGRDEPAEDDDGERILPEVAKGEAMERSEVRPRQHFTEPPPRYTEASLVKRLEELGIGRPSTYASIISVLQDRGYVVLEQKRFKPEDRGRLVTAFLTGFFDHWIQPGFTASLETELDDVAAGERHWKDVLRDFWAPFNEALNEASDKRVAEVIEALNRLLADHLFPPKEDGTPARGCPLCADGELSLKLGRYGAFVGCSNYPECKYTRPFSAKEAEQVAAQASGERLLGVDPESADEVWLRIGRYGPYVELSGEEKKRSSLPPNIKADDVTLEQALALLALPREIGAHPESGEPVSAGINRYGPFVQHGRQFVRLGPDEDVLTIGMNRAMALLDEAKTRKGGSAGPLRVLGEHPEKGGEIQVLSGRFGPYVKLGKVNASLPKGTTPEEITLEQAVQLIDARAAKAGNGKARAKSGKSAAKPTAKQANGADAKSASTKTSTTKTSSTKKTAVSKAKTTSKSSAKSTSRSKSAGSRAKAES
ncbi:MAG: type I DNA topoisomerase [Geminicoccaceae bacterium]